MKRLPLIAAAMTLALAATPASGPAHAAGSVQKCRSADGSVGYTDGSCAVFGADAVAIESRAFATPAETGGDLMGLPAMDATTGSDDRGAAIAAGRRSPADGCARSPTQLAMDLRTSLAMGDVNRVAESYHWAGMSNAQGQRTMDRLQQLVGREVLDSRYIDASFGSAALYASADATAPVADGAGMLQVLLGNGDGAGAAVAFDVHRYAGCYFVSFQG